jgi:hypothetical protein
MTTSYKFGGGSERQNFGPLPPGDYTFSVLSADPEYKNDKWILHLKLAIHPGGDWVWAHPWSGTTSSGDERDGVGDFLLAINHAPAIGKEPAWDELIGARGRVRLKLETAPEAFGGKPRAVVAFFHKPKQIEPSAPPQSYSREEYEQSAHETPKRTRAPKDDFDQDDPDTIPF